MLLSVNRVAATEAVKVCQAPHKGYMIRTSSRLTYRHHLPSVCAAVNTCLLDVLHVHSLHGDSTEQVSVTLSIAKTGIVDVGPTSLCVQIKMMGISMVDSTKVLCPENLFSRCKDTKVLCPIL